MICPSVFLNFFSLHSFIHSFIHSLTHSLTPSSLHPSVRPCVCAFVPSLIRLSSLFSFSSFFLIPCLCISLTHSLTHSSIHPSIHPSIRPSVRPCICAFVPSSIRPFSHFSFFFLSLPFLFSHSLSACLFFSFSSFLPFFSLLFLLYFSRRRV